MRRTLGVDRGDDVIFEIAGGQVTVSPSPPRRRFHQYVGRYRVGKGRTGEQVDEFVQRLRGRDGDE